MANPILHHVTLKTTRPDEMTAWYGAVVGMRVQHRFEGGAWLTNDGANHRIAMLMTPQIDEDPGKLGHSGMHHTAFEHATMDELLDGYVRLRDAGIRPHACLDHGMTLSMYYLDPDGNSVELQVDEFGDWSASGEFMHSSPLFAANPIGAAFDPELLLAAREAGAGPEELHRRAYAGEFDPGTPLDLRLP
jgi:catechol 2,3-dioxygenase